MLEALAGVDGGFRCDFQSFDWGFDYYRRHGEMMPADGVDVLRSFDAIYFGAVGDAELPDDLTLWGLRLAISRILDQFANVGPTQLLPGVAGPLKPVLVKW